MTFLTDAQIKQLKSNGQPGNRDQDHSPMVKLFLPFTGCIWLLSALDPDDPDIACGLCDLGMGFPELGNVWLTELQSIAYRPDVGIEQDAQFSGDYPMSVYAAAARAGQAITTDPVTLWHAQARLQSRRCGPNAPRPC